MSVMGDRDLDAIPTVEDFKDMPYLNMVIKEVWMIHIACLIFLTHFIFRFTQL